MSNSDTDIPPSDNSNVENAQPKPSHSQEPVPLPPEAERIAELEAELAESRDRLLRALAETENVRRRGEREREDTAKFAIARFAGDLLSVADNLRRALDAVPGEARDESELMAKLLDGVGATERELLNVFEKAGLKRIEPLGESFDPHFHEVMFEMETADKPVGTVVQIFQPGYKIGERLLRPARVVVAKGGSKTERVDTQA